MLSIVYGDVASKRQEQLERSNVSRIHLPFKMASAMKAMKAMKKAAPMQAMKAAKQQRTRKKDNNKNVDYSIVGVGDWFVFGGGSRDARPGGCFVLVGGGGSRVERRSASHSHRSR